MVAPSAEPDGLAHPPERNGQVEFHDCVNAKGLSVERPRCTYPSAEGFAPSASGAPGRPVALGLPDCQSPNVTTTRAGPTAWGLRAGTPALALPVVSRTYLSDITKVFLFLRRFSLHALVRERC